MNSESVAAPRTQSDRQFLTWSRISPSNNIVPPPRSGAASALIGKKIYLFGGYGGGTGRLDDFWSFDFETGEWEEVKVLSEEKPCCRENNGVVVSDTDKMSVVLFAGYSGHVWLNDLWEFNIATSRWTCLHESSSDPILDDTGAAGVIDGQPGEHAAGNQVTGRAPSRRFGYVSVVHQGESCSPWQWRPVLASRRHLPDVIQPVLLTPFKGKLIIWAGFNGTTWLQDLHVFDFGTKTWTEIIAKGRGPSARSCPAWATSTAGICYVHGGYNGHERLADGWALDLATYTWTEMPCLGTPPSPRYFHSCCLYGRKLWLYAGYDGTSRLSDMYVYDFETSHWSQVDCTAGEAPSGRSSLVMQVHEASSSLCCFGGYDGRAVLNSFYKFRLPIAVPPPALVNDFRRLINNPDLADVHLLVEGHDVYAHKAVLAIRSEYFRVMLCGGMRESEHFQMTKGDTAPIELKEVSYKVFLKVLEFLYTDTVNEVSLEMGIHLLVASEQFMLDRLKALCEDVLQRDVHVDTVIEILVASHRHNAKVLKDIALEFILKNLNDPIIMGGLSDLRSEPDLLLEIIKRSTATSQSLEVPAQQSNNSQNFSGIGPLGGVAEWDARR